jgi:hypothetical protein
MTSQINCDIYYSIAGGPFQLSQIDTGLIAHSPATLYIYTHDQATLASLSDITLSAQGFVTELSIPKPIKKGQFFNSESWCLFLNKAGQVLKVDSSYLFPIYMRRDVNDHERLHIRFVQQYFAGRHCWEDIPSAVIPEHHL